MRGHVRARLREWPLPSRRAQLRAAAIATLLLGGASPGCYLAHERETDAGAPSVDAAASPPLVWVLVHPSDAPRGPGLYLFDEARQEVLRQLPLPEGVTSPHALAWDGHSLWLGGIDVDPAVREIDPADGHVLSRWPGVVTEGIAHAEGTFWYSAEVDAQTPLVHVTRDGRMLGAFTLPEITVQDVVSANGALYYLVNDAADRIVRFDVATGATTEVARDVDVAPYALGFDGTYLAVAVDGIIRRFDPTTGALVREDPFAVPGWITAIAFVR